MKNIFCRCTNCGRDEIIPNGVDGIGCVCGGKFNFISLTNLTATRDKMKCKEENDVVIKLTSASEPPIVTINGSKVQVNSLDLNYKTETDEPGTHNLTLVYVGDDCYRLAGFKK